MAENKHNAWDLAQMQSLSLDAKIRMTQYRIREWYDHWDGQVYVSFSGGKDSTVLVDIVRNVCGFKDVPLVYVDTGLEYPEIREFVRSYGDAVTWLKPEMQFKKVIETYGYPFISKEVSQTIYEINRAKDRGKDPQELSQWLRLTGQYTVNGEKAFSREKYIFFMKEGAPRISNKCCQIMKKNPSHRYQKKTGRKPITAQMACESILRKTTWIKQGCNAFDTKYPISNPLSFWTEQDILQYIKKSDLSICSVYGDIVEDLRDSDEVAGQMTISDMVGFEDQSQFDAERMPLKTTGCDRTGCMFCGYGCHLNNDERFTRMKETHPKQYEWIMKPWSEGGLGYKDVIDWINENGNLNIRY